MFIIKFIIAFQQHSDIQFYYKLPYSDKQNEYYVAIFGHLTILPVYHFRVAFKQQKARILSPPCGKSAEYLLLPVTRQQIAPLLLTTCSVMIYHRGASLSEQHTHLLCTKQDLSHTSRYVDESSPEIARYRIRMPTARTATLSVTTYA